MGKNKKKPAHFTEKKKKIKKSEREVLSFEELPLEEYEKPKKKIKNKQKKEKPQKKANTEKKEKKERRINIDKKRVFMAVGILVLLVLVVLGYFTRGFFGCGKDKSIACDFSATVSGSSVDAGNFRTMSDGLCYASDSEVVYLDCEGDEQFSSQHGFAKPILKTAGSKAIAYDLGANDFAIYSTDGVEFSESMKEKIYLADITSGGNYAFVTETKGYNAKLYAFNSDNKVTYTYSFADYHITSMALNSSGSRAAVIGVSADEGLQVSALYVIDFSKEEPIAKHIVSDDLIFDCDFLTDYAIGAVGQEGAYVLNGSSLSRIEKISYNGMSLTSYDINSGAMALSVSRSGDGSNCNIMYVNSLADVEKVIETSFSILSVSVYKNRIAICDTSNVYLYENDGDLLEEYASSSLKQVRLYTIDGVYLLGHNSITGVAL